MHQLSSAFLNVVLFGSMFVSTFIGGVMTGGAYIQVAEAAPKIGAQVAALVMSDTSNASNFEKKMPPKEVRGMMPEKMGSSTMMGKPPMPGVRACVALAIKQTLKRGSQGDDVSKLQKRLIEEGYLASSSPLGFFGSLTEKAVAKWQMEQGLASSSEPSAEKGIGMVGPRTRALFEKCENRIEKRVEDRLEKQMEKREGMGSTTMLKKPLPPPTDSYLRY